MRLIDLLHELERLQPEVAPTGIQALWSTAQTVSSQCICFGLPVRVTSTYKRYELRTLLEFRRLLNLNRDSRNLVTLSVRCTVGTYSVVTYRYRCGTVYEVKNLRSTVLLATI
jgi:hypothetical protein